MPKIRAGALPPGEPGQKASRVATMSRVASREKNLQRVAKILKSL